MKFMREEFEKMVAAGKIEQRHVEPLVELTESGFCMHRSWGFGRIRTVDTVFGRFTIDFPGKESHGMDLAFSVDALKPIPKDHILALKASEPDKLKQLAATNHLELVKVVLNSYDGKATIDQIQQALVPDVISEDWKKWWEAARHELKKDGHFLIPIKKSEPIVYQSSEISLHDRLLEAFRSAKGLKARVVVATEAARSVEDLTGVESLANEMISTLNREIPSHQRTKPAVALEAIFARDDLRTAAKMDPAEGELTAAAIWGQELIFAEVLEALPAAKQRRAIESFKEAKPESWQEAALLSLNVVSSRLCKELALALINADQMEALKETLARLISQHSASSEALLWLGKERSDAFADILGPEVFRAMISAMERDQFNEKRSNRLRDFIMSDQRLLADLTAAADLDVIRDVTRGLQLSTIFDDMDKRSLLARLVKSHPSIQSLISGEQSSKQDNALIVSWESLDRKRNDYAELVQKKIPENSKEIAIARSYGDLRENHEYKAAKEMQKILMRRKEELESELTRARGTDFANPRTDQVSVGTVVQATDVESGKQEQFTILGAWDSDPEKGIISYLSPVAQAILNKSAGEQVEFDVYGEKHHHRIDKIEVFNADPGSGSNPAEPIPAKSESVSAG
jgi:transcription elongation GreA/GreB family factor